MDCWTDPNSTPFVAVTAHWICPDRDGRLVMRANAIAFRHLPGSHTGKHIAEAIMEILDQAGVTKRTGWWTLDNASNNDTFMAELEKLLNERGVHFERDGNRIRCFPHIINIAVQTTLSTFTTLSNASDNVEFVPTTLNDEETQSYTEALKRDPVSICRAIVRQLRASSLRRDDFRKIAADQKLPSHELLRDVETRWDSVYTMIDRVIEMKKVSRTSFLKSTAAHISLGRRSFSLPSREPQVSQHEEALDE